LQEYAVVAEKNLFHPDRIIPVLKVEVTVPRPEFVLYGTLITDQVSIAYLSDSKAPRTTPGRGPRQTSLKIGETMSGYTLKEILHDSIVMVHGDDRIVVNVLADSKKKRTGPATIASTPQASPGPPGAVAPMPAANALPQIQRSVAAPPVIRRGRY
jgi:type II secretory pathway component PulC